MLDEPRFTLGIEEEYLLVDPQTRDLIDDQPPGLLEECQEALGERVSPEFLQCQIEVGTGVFSSIAEARIDLAELPSTVARIASAHGVSLMAASTHPFAIPGAQKRTNKERYATIERDLQEVVRRLTICGMHVHVGIEDEDLRIELMSQVSYVPSLIHI